MLVGEVRFAVNSVEALRRQRFAAGLLLKQAVNLDIVATAPKLPAPGETVTGADLRAAIDATLAGLAPHVEQLPSLGCNIKWRKGNEPDYARG